jgi:acyl carrier protein
MTKEKVLEKLQPIFRDIFDDDSLIINEDTDADDIEEWDSFNNINLVASIEREFNINFDLKQLQDMENVGDMAKAIIEAV